jgi:hypothetical protein
MLSLFASDVLEKSPVLLFPVVALLLFVSVFTFVSFRAIRMRKPDVSRLASLPLENDQGEVHPRRTSSRESQHG